MLMVATMTRKWKLCWSVHPRSIAKFEMDVCRLCILSSFSVSHSLKSGVIHELSPSIF